MFTGDGPNEAEICDLLPARSLKRDELAIGLEKTVKSVHSAERSLELSWRATPAFQELIDSAAGRLRAVSVCLHCVFA